MRGALQFEDIDAVDQKDRRCPPGYDRRTNAQPGGRQLRCGHAAMIRSDLYERIPAQ
jgi:hypothetical protein